MYHWYSCTAVQLYSVDCTLNCHANVCMSVYVQRVCIGFFLVLICARFIEPPWSPEEAERVLWADDYFVLVYDACMPKGVCMHVCMCAQLCMCVQLCVCMRVQLCVYLCVYVCATVCVTVYSCANLYAGMNVYAWGEYLVVGVCLWLCRCVRGHSHPYDVNQKPVP